METTKQRATIDNTFTVLMLSSDFGNRERTIVLENSFLAAQEQKIRDSLEVDERGYPIDPSGLRLETLTEILDVVFVQGQNDVNPIDNTASVSVGDVIQIPSTLSHRLDMFTANNWVVTPDGFKPLTSADLDEYIEIPVADRTWSRFVRPEFVAKQAAKKAEAQKPKDNERQIMVAGFEGDLIPINILSTPVAGFAVNATDKTRWAAYGEAVGRNTTAESTDPTAEARAIVFRNISLVVTAAEIKRLESAGHSFVVLTLDEWRTDRAYLISTAINA